MGKKKKFIDKKQSATFQLVARDSSEPNYDSELSSDRVFLRVDNNPKYSVDSFFNDNVEDPNSIFADASDDNGYEDYGLAGPSASYMAPGNITAPLSDRIRKEILELGFPDDGYNYLIHLREIKNTGGGSTYYQNAKSKFDQLPHDVKAYDASRLDICKVNDDSDEKSIYNVAAKTVGVRIQKAVDPEVAALLDDSDLSRFGSDDEDLEEDFVVKANLAEGSVDAELEKKLSLVDNSEMSKQKNVDFNAYLCQSSAELDRESDTTNLMESFESCFLEKPRVRRDLDEHFDEVELKEYGDGEEEFDEYTFDEDKDDNAPLAEKLNHALKHHPVDRLQLEDEDKYISPSDLLHDKVRSEDVETMESASYVIRQCMKYAEKFENSDQDADLVVSDDSSDVSEKYDCETIISTLSNLDNHPAKIVDPNEGRFKKLTGILSTGLSSTPSHVISLKGRDKIPVDFWPGNRNPSMEKPDGIRSSKTEPHKRKQHGQETKEEKKERKAAVKQERREARRAKKEMKGLYKSESHRAQKAAALTTPSGVHLM